VGFQADDRFVFHTSVILTRNRAQLDSSTVAQTGSLPYRGLAIREAFPFSMACRMPFGDTADYQSALHAPTRRRSVLLSSCALRNLHAENNGDFSRLQ